MPTKRSRTPSLARQRDRYDLYQRAVQSPDAEIDFVDATFRALRKRKARTLREDFCGAAAAACEWVRRRPTNTAVGVDLDPEPLEWGRAHNLARLTGAQRRRLTLRQADVMDARASASDHFDIVLAMNFSYWCFKERATLVRYFGRVRRALARDGVFFLDYMGGSEAHLELRERRKVGRAGKAFTYVWHQRQFNPITADFRASIHFTFPDGSRMNDAFTYDWRLWGVPEIRDALRDAGFRRTIVYWEGDDGKGGGNGEFAASESGEACAGYIGYISAVP